jgi:chemotaxis signal transduction protein
MTGPDEGLTKQLRELRESFDRSFALPPDQPMESWVRYLVIGVGADRYALELDALLGLETRRKIVPLPFQAPGLLGLAGLRGRPTPVFSLASLLDRPGGADSPRWLALCKGPAALALAFDRFEGLAQVSSRDKYATDPMTESSIPARQTIRTKAGMIAILDIPAVIAAAKQRLTTRV